VSGRRQELLATLQSYGALPCQLVDVASEAEPRALGYLDLRAPAPHWQAPVVVENAGRPCVHVFDARGEDAEGAVAQWCWRTALRGDGAFVGRLLPGRLEVYRVDVERDTDAVRPVSVETAEPGDWALPRFLNEVRTGQNDVARRRYMTQLLDRSAQQAIGRGLSPIDALSLVGRGLFWRFLIDRHLLDHRSPADICQGARTWEQCFDTKSRALRTFAWLDRTFNGGLLPFEGEPREFDARVFSEVLANIAYGAAETGQLRLPTDWREINFAYVPVGLLSEVYEAFTHNLDRDQARRDSIHYTPSHLVDFIVSQALAAFPVEPEPHGRAVCPRVLDPAAGAGVFLVTALRKLVEREWAATGERPMRPRIREILNGHITGFDIDGRALRLCELALYLTALELDPAPLPVEELTFDALRDRVLFDVSDRAHGSLGPVEERFRNAFDLVVGNPPWTAEGRGLADKKAWVAGSRRIVEERLGPARAQSFSLPDANKDLPFVWRAMEWAKPRVGRIALITHARWLFDSAKATEARRDILEALRVTGILNGAALRLTSVWPEVDAPFCVLFAANERPEPVEHAAFQFISPSLDTERESEQARLRIDWFDAEVVRVADVLARPWTLKARFRGNRLATRVLDAILSRGRVLRDYLGELGVEFRQGYQVVGDANPARHMRGWPDTKGAKRIGFSVDVGALQPFRRQTLHRPREPWIYEPPLLLLRKAMPADLREPRVHLAGERVSFHESFYGASFAEVPAGAAVAAYLQIVLQSSLFPFFGILTDAQYGVFVDAMYKENAEKLPVVPFDRLSRQQKQQSNALSKRLAAGRLDDGLAGAIDELVFDAFELSDVERETVRDTLDTALTSTRSKQASTRVPSPRERAAFLWTLRSSLEDVLSASRLRAEVRERDDLGWSPWLLVEVCLSSAGGFEAVEPPGRRFLEEADANGASLVVARASEATWFLGLLARYASWTATRARILASDLLAQQGAA
jgi:hypothetical protein